MQPLKESDVVLRVFLDFSKAFDTVNHEIVLSKLSKYGMRGVGLKWFHSYLNNRKQYVTFEITPSANKVISCGAPQGSI